MEVGEKGGSVRNYLWLAMAMLMLVGCQVGGVANPTPEASTRPTAGSPSPTAEPTDELVAASQHIGNYLDALDAWRRQPKNDFSSVVDYLVGGARTMVVGEMDRLIRSRSRIVGTPVYSLQVDVPRLNADGIMEARANLCVDLSGVKLVGPDGVELDLPVAYKKTFDLRKLDDNSWAIYKIRNRGSRC